MARSRGRVDLQELKNLAKRFEKLDERQINEFNEELVKEKVKYFLGNVTRLTPVGQYNDGRVGGILRRGWTTASEREAQLSSTFNATRNNINDYVDNKIKVTKTGKTYSIEVKNNVSYASYVNYGHRTRGGGGYVNGQFFLEKALATTGTNSRKILDRKLIKLLRGVVNGDGN